MILNATIYSKVEKKNKKKTESYSGFTFQSHGKIINKSLNTLTYLVKTGVF